LIIFPTAARTVKNIQCYELLTITNDYESEYQTVVKKLLLNRNLQSITQKQHFSI